MGKYTKIINDQNYLGRNKTIFKQLDFGEFDLLSMLSYYTFESSNLNSVSHFWTQSKLKPQVPWDMPKFY